MPFFLGLGDLAGGDVYSLAFGISADGTTVVGTSRVGHFPSGEDAYEAFQWTAADGLAGIGDLGTGPPKSRARAVSADGSVVVGEADPDGGLTRTPFRWTSASGLVALQDSAGGSQSGAAHDVSGDGDVVFGVWGDGANQAFRWTPATGVVGLGWLPSDSNDSFAFGCSGDGAVACGISNSGSEGGVEPFVWTVPDGLVGLGDIPGGIFYAIAWGVSRDGSTLVGGARASNGNDEPFLWTEAGGFVFPDATHGATFSSELLAASADGSVAVGYDGDGGMIWDAVHGMRSVANVLANDLGLDLGGWLLGAVSDVSDDGLTLTGSGVNPSGDFEAWVAHLGDGAVAAPAPARPSADAGLQLRIRSANPFSSEIALEVASAPGAMLHAGVYDVRGRLVRLLLRGVAGSGVHAVHWDGRDVAGARAPSGVYLVVAETSNRRAATRVVLRR
jgi:uncharacterized membrane protein